MQPENLPVPSGPELPPTNPAQGGERIPVLPTPENGVDVGLERAEQTAEASAAAANAVYQGAPVPPPIAAPIPTRQTTDDTPAIAGDEDVIEKEWVDKAKKIILETKDDPYGRSARVNELQKDYLRKRYSKELGASE